MQSRANMVNNSILKNYLWSPKHQNWMSKLRLNRIVLHSLSKALREGAKRTSLELECVISRMMPQWTTSAVATNCRQFQQVTNTLSRLFVLLMASSQIPVEENCPSDSLVPRLCRLKHWSFAPFPLYCPSLKRIIFIMNHNAFVCLLCSSFTLLKAEQYFLKRVMLGDISARGCLHLGFVRTCRVVVVTSALEPREEKGNMYEMQRVASKLNPVVCYICLRRKISRVQTQPSGWCVFESQHFPVKSNGIIISCSSFIETNWNLPSHPKEESLWKVLTSGE